MIYPAPRRWIFYCNTSALRCPDAESKSLAQAAIQRVVSQSPQSMKAVGRRKSRKKGRKEKKKKGTPVSLLAQIMRRRVVKHTPDHHHHHPRRQTLPPEQPHHRVQRKAGPAVNIWVNVEWRRMRNGLKTGVKEKECLMKMCRSLPASLLCLYGSRRPVD